MFAFNREAMCTVGQAAKPLLVSRFPLCPQDPSVPAPPLLAWYHSAHLIHFLLISSLMTRMSIMCYLPHMCMALDRSVRGLWVRRSGLGCSSCDQKVSGSNAGVIRVIPLLDPRGSPFTPIRPRDGLTLCSVAC